MENFFFLYGRPDLLRRTIKKEQYIHHNNKENISTLEDMELTLCKLLEGERIDLFLDNPKDIYKIIKRERY